MKNYRVALLETIKTVHVHWIAAANAVDLASQLDHLETNLDDHSPGSVEILTVKEVE